MFSFSNAQLCINICVLLPVKLDRIHAFIVSAIYLAQCLAHTCLITICWMHVAKRFAHTFYLICPAQKYSAEILWDSVLIKNSVLGLWSLITFFLKRIWFWGKSGKGPYNLLLSWFLVQFSACRTYTRIQIPCVPLFVILSACSAPTLPIPSHQLLHNFVFK